MNKAKKRLILISLNINMIIKKMPMLDDYLIVFCTVPNENAALKISQSLVAEKLAACCNIIAGLRSLFFWKEELCDESELLLVIKTKSGVYDRLEKQICSLHPYDVPEVLAFSIKKGSDDYLKWIDANVK